MSEKPILLWDAGPGEARAGLVEAGQIAEFRIIRRRHPEKALYQAGEFYTARVVERTSHRTALVSLGLQQAVLDPAPADCTTGKLVCVIMTRPAIPEPGRWKPTKVRLAPDPKPLQTEPGWHFSAEPWALYLQSLAPQVGTIICADASMAVDVERTLGSASPPVRVDRRAVDEADFEALIETATTGQLVLDEGVQLSIERTRAMTVIDVDGFGDPMMLNSIAARHIARVLRRFDIGGPVAIDFIAMAGRNDRLALADAFDAAATNLGQHERTAINGFGLMQLIRPRTRPSVPEILCATTPTRLSTESRAIALLRAAARAAGIGPRRLVAPPAIIDLIRQWPWEIAALRHACGAEILLVPDSGATGYGHVHVAQS